jgi:hypothetical protein
MALARRLGKTSAVLSNRKMAMVMVGLPATLDHSISARVNDCLW